MKETVLLYNFSDDRLLKIQRALLPLKVSIKAVTQEEYAQPIGFLAGIKEIKPVDNKYKGDVFTDEMMLICGLPNTKIDSLIRALYKNGLGKIDLKAILTHANIEWNSTQLYEAVKADHEAMSKGKN